MARGQPMTQLLQGTSASGKTVVAALAALAAVEAGQQVAFVAPNCWRSSISTSCATGWLNCP